MKYQLVLQWPASSIDDYDTLILLEDILIDSLSSGEEIDGHDGGSGQFNIFIHTDNPDTTFERIKKLLSETESWTDLKAAYRKFDEQYYQILWPHNLSKFTIS